MLSEKMLDALNVQINKEMYSAYMYLSMSASFVDKTLPGFAHWLRVQYGEEMKHAMKIYDYIQQRNGPVKLKTIDAAPGQFETPLAAFEAVYAHEQKVTGMINKLVDMAIAEKDHATQSFLKWFVDEQVEEENSSLDLVNKLKMIGDSVHGLFMLDRVLAQRGS